jgi:hypothetical protein
VLDTGDPDRPQRLVAELTQRNQALVEIAQHRRQRLPEPFARRRRGDAARGAGDQRHTEPFFQPLDDLAQGRLRKAEPGCGAGEVAFFHHDGEGRQIGHVLATHSSSQ